MSLVDEILNSADIVEIVWEYVNLKKTWKNYTALCPFHSEKTPSFVVSPDKQIFKCFWCWKWWNVITFIKEIENIDFYDALKILAEKLWIDIKKYQKNISQNQKELDLKEQLLSVNKAALNYFHKQIFENDKALNYLQNERHLTKDIIVKYKLWYAPEKWSDFLSYLKEKWFSEQIILQAGLAKKSASWSLYPFFTNRIIFPIFNSLWEVVAFSWRVFDKNATWWKYINTPETILYHKSKILYNFNNTKKTKKDFIIVVEWYMDVIWLDRLGYDNAVATCGTVLTPHHIKILKRITNNIVFSFDSDQAWQEATLRWCKIALAEWIYPKIFQIENWKDFDEIANLVDSWELKKPQIEENTQDLVSYFIDKFLWNYHQLWPVEKEKNLEEVFDILRQIWNYSIFWDYLEKVAKKIWQDANILYQQLKAKKTFQKRNQQEKENLDNKFIIPALFYKNFFENYNLWDIFETYIWYILEILDFLPENNLIKKVLTENLSIEEKEKLLEKQLWWENTLLGQTQDKIKQKIWNELKIYLINLFTDLIKNWTLSNEQKLELMRKIQEVRKR